HHGSIRVRFRISILPGVIPAFAVAAASPIMAYRPRHARPFPQIPGDPTMATLRLGDTAPDFEQSSSAGPIRLYDYLGDSWGVLFSHPADFTPVCTTELGFTAKL